MDAVESDIHNNNMKDVIKRTLLECADSSFLSDKCDSKEFIMHL